MVIDLPRDAEYEEIPCHDEEFSHGGTGLIVVGRLGPDANTAFLHIQDAVTGQSATVGLDGNQMSRLHQAAGYLLHGM